MNKYIEQFEKYLDESKDDQIAIIELLNIYIKTRCYLKYEKLFNSAYERFPSNAILNRVQGKYLLFCKNKFSDARLFLERAIQINPEQPSWVKYLSGHRESYFEKVWEDVLYTPIPKNGSTSLKSYLLNKKNITDVNPHSYFGNPYFSAKRISNTNEFKKVIVLRDPIDRVISYHKKNILEADSLSEEVGIEGLKKLYGLTLKPTLNEFIERIELYVMCFNDVFHHILPQAAYIESIEDYDYVVDISDVDSLVQYVSKHIGFDDVSAPEKMVGKKSKNIDISGENLKKLASMYKDDYVLLKKAGIKYKNRECLEPSFSNYQPEARVEVESNFDVKLRREVNELKASINFIMNVINDMYLNFNDDFMSVNSITELVLKAVHDKTSFSLIRFGDGEGTILGKDQNSSKEDINKIIDIHFGDELDNDDIEFIKKELKLSFDNADVLGIPSYNRSIKTNSLGRIQRGIISVYSYIQRYSRTKAKFCQANIHIELYKSDFFSRLAAESGKITLITCRTELPAILKEKYTFSEVKLYEIPTESKYGQKDLIGKHYPDYYESIRSSLSVEPGEVFLIAAGLLGKSYCNLVKSKGGIAIDIGSIADAWCGINSRPYIESEKIL